MIEPFAFMFAFSGFSSFRGDDLGVGLLGRLAYRNRTVWQILSDRPPEVSPVVSALPPTVYQILSALVRSSSTLSQPFSSTQIISEPIITLSYPLYELT